MNIGSDMVHTIEDLWAQAQKIHISIPHAIVSVGSGRAGYSMPRWGHVVDHMWGDDQVGSEGNYHHFLICGETFAAGAEQTLATLLHEAAHLIAAERDIKDTSNGGRYHNKKFKEIAEELGLVVEKSGTFGFCDTTLADGTIDLYDISGVESLIQIHWSDLDVTNGGKKGSHEIPGGKEKGSNRTGGPLKTTCQCGLIVYMSRKVHDKYSVECSECGMLFIQHEEA